MKLKEIPRSILTARKVNKLYTNSTGTQNNQANIIISLTSIPNRLATLHLTIKSLLAQDVLPKKIVLWLEHELEHITPLNLKNLTGEKFTIYYRPGQSSHRKLTFALNEFSEDTIVTCDDDVMYAPDWLRSLVADHLKYPSAIITHECRKIPPTNNNECPPYHEWPYCTSTGAHGASLCPIGYGGVLYPPGSLHKDATNSDLYLKLAPKADDLWFKAMGLKQGTPIRKCSTFVQKPVPILGAKGNSLAKTNILKDGNRQQWLAICAHYGIDNRALTQC